MEYVQLNNGIKMPMLGYGVYQVTKNECERCVTDALSVGYRLIDTAQSYFNEEEVGAAITKSGIPREEIFLTTKVWVEHYGYEECKKSVYTSLEKLKTDYLDLIPAPAVQRLLRCIPCIGGALQRGRSPCDRCIQLLSRQTGRHRQLCKHRANGKSGGNARPQSAEGRQGVHGQVRRTV